MTFAGSGGSASGDDEGDVSDEDDSDGDCKGEKGGRRGVKQGGRAGVYSIRGPAVNRAAEGRCVHLRVCVPVHVHVCVHA